MVWFQVCPSLGSKAQSPSGGSVLADSRSRQRGSGQWWEDSSTVDNQYWYQFPSRRWGSLSLDWYLLVGNDWINQSLKYTTGALCLLQKVKSFLVSTLKVKLKCVNVRGPYWLTEKCIIDYNLLCVCGGGGLCTFQFSSLCKVTFEVHQFKLGSTKF